MTAAHAEAHSPPPDGPREILVVDDEESLRQTFEVFLAGAGYRVASSNSVESAMAMMHDRHFDAVITDIVMPGGDGLSLLQAIHDQDTERPVILMTGNPSVTSAAAAVRGGAFDYLAKPVKKDQLLQIVRRAVDRYTLIEEKRRLQETNDRQAKTLAEYVQRLEGLSRAKDRMTALLVHDFKNPLSVITSNVSLLRTTPELVALDEDVRESLADVQEASQGLLRMVTMLLDISRMEDERMHLQLADVPIDELAEACLTRFRAIAAHRRVRMEFAVTRGAVAPVDRMLLERVLDNLISNGLRYTPAGGLLRVGGGRTDGSRAVLTVENNGPPIPADMRAVVFDKYGHVEGDTERTHLNRGLGLYFCRLAVESHRGVITVEDPEGGGVRFRIDLPLSPGA